MPMKPKYFALILLGTFKNCHHVVDIRIVTQRGRTPFLLLRNRNSYDDTQLTRAKTQIGHNVAMDVVTQQGVFLQPITPSKSSILP